MRVCHEAYAVTRASRAFAYVQQHCHTVTQDSTYRTSLSSIDLSVKAAAPVTGGWRRQRDLAQAGRASCVVCMCTGLPSQRCLHAHCQLLGMQCGSVSRFQLLKVHLGYASNSLPHSCAVMKLVDHSCSRRPAQLGCFPGDERLACRAPALRKLFQMHPDCAGIHDAVELARLQTARLVHEPLPAR